MGGWDVVRSGAARAADGGDGRRKRAGGEGAGGAVERAAIYAYLLCGRGHPASILLYGVHTIYTRMYTCRYHITLFFIVYTCYLIITWQLHTLSVVVARVVCGGKCTLPQYIWCYDTG